MKKTCPGRSGINKTIMKKIPPTAITRLTKIFSAEFSAGYLSDKCKESIIKLISKQGKSHYPVNYRPISLLEVPGKIFERIINRKLRTHIEYNELYHTHQYGFR